MMQKEVAQRFFAKPSTKQYNNLSIMLQYYCDIKMLFDVKPQSFYPKPKVTSTVVHFTIKQKISSETTKFCNFV